MWESRAASGQPGISEQKGSRAAPGSCVGEILESGQPRARSQGSGRFGLRAVHVGLGVPRGDCVRDLGLEISTVLPSLRRITLLTFVQETVSPGARKEPGWPGL